MTFGQPIDLSVLSGLPAFTGKTPNVDDLSRYTKSRKSDSETDALEQLRGLAELQKHHRRKSLIAVYNATGHTLHRTQLVSKHGHIGTEGFASSIENGVWDLFVHVNVTGGSKGSNGTLAWNLQGIPTTQWYTIGWDTPLHKGHDAAACGVLNSPAGFAGEYSRGRGHSPLYVFTLYKASATE